MLRTVARSALARTTGLVGLQASDTARVELVETYQNIMEVVKVRAGYITRDELLTTATIRGCPQAQLTVPVWRQQRSIDWVLHKELKM